ncbi:helix-turn-helix domain-containing protein [Zunongwangia sp. H14]|uniref:helix-turn-helix domain-containing protein n=1 Tax=Zunongwangia sp. H14 TaxID=3240792 RepID=UPI003563AFCF
METERIERSLFKIVELLTKLEVNQREFLDFNQAQKFLGLGASTLYKLTSQRKIKFYKPNRMFISTEKYTTISFQKYTILN